MCLVSTCRYNVPESSSPASFSLTVETLESWPPQLKTCFTYTGSRYRAQPKISDAGAFL